MPRQLVERVRPEDGVVPRCPGLYSVLEAVQRKEELCVSALRELVVGVEREEAVGSAEGLGEEVVWGGELSVEGAVEALLAGGWGGGGRHCSSLE